MGTGSPKSAAIAVANLRSESPRVSYDSFKRLLFVGSKLSSGPGCVKNADTALKSALLRKIYQVLRS